MYKVEVLISRLAVAVQIANGSIYAGPAWEKGMNWKRLFLMFSAFLVVMPHSSTNGQDPKNSARKTLYPSLGGIRKLYIDTAGNGSPASRDFAQTLRSTLASGHCVSVVGSPKEADAVFSSRPLKDSASKTSYQWIFIDQKTDLILAGWHMPDSYSSVASEVTEVVNALGCAPSPPPTAASAQKGGVIVRLPNEPTVQRLPSQEPTNVPPLLGNETPALPPGVTADEYSYVRGIVLRLERNRYRLPAFHWAIVPASQLNSSADPQRRIMYVYTSMVQFLRDDPGEMAFVIAHELGHIEDAPYQLAEIQVEKSSLLPQLVQQKLETRADDIGFQYLVGAGFNPYDAAALFGRLQMFQGDTGLIGFFQQFLSNHPINGARVSNLRRLFQQFCATGQLRCTATGEGD